MNEQQRGPLPPGLGESVLTMYTIFWSPLDHPGRFIVRGFDVVRGLSEPQPHHVFLTCDSLERARECIPRGLYCLARDPSDHPSVVETWT